MEVCARDSLWANSYLESGHGQNPRLTSRGSAVDITRIRGMLLRSPAPGPLAGPTGSSGSEQCHGEGRQHPAAALEADVVCEGLREPAALIRLDRGLGVERARAPSRQRRPNPWPAGRTSVRRRCPGPFLPGPPGWHYSPAGSLVPRGTRFAAGGHGSPSARGNASTGISWRAPSVTPPVNQRRDRQR